MSGLGVGMTSICRAFGDFLRSLLGLEDEKEGTARLLRMLWIVWFAGFYSCFRVAQWMSNSGIYPL